MKQIRLLAVGHSYGLAANRVALREVASDPGFDITVAAPSYFFGDLRPIQCEPEPDGSPLKLAPIPARWSRWIHVFHYSERSLARLILKGGFDAVYAWEEPYVLSGYQIARLTRRSGARFSFLSFQNYSKRFPMPFAYFERATVRAAARWAAGGKTVFDNLVGRGYSGDRGRVIVPAVDTAAFRPANACSRISAQQRLGLKPPVIGFLGRLVEAKGIPILMKALESLDPELPWSLLLLGSGSMQSAIETWAAARGWQDRVKIHLARHDEVPELLPAMDLLVAPSQSMPNWKEQFGRMLIEAFACGIPVIASDSGEIPNVVGDSGFIVPEKDVVAWTRQIDALLRDEDLRIQTARAGLARVARFSVPEIARQWREFYMDLTNAKSI